MLNSKIKHSSHSEFKTPSPPSPSSFVTMKKPDMRGITHLVIISAALDSNWPEVFSMLDSDVSNKEDGDLHDVLLKYANESGGSEIIGKIEMYFDTNKPSIVSHLLEEGAAADRSIIHNKIYKSQLIAGESDFSFAKNQPTTSIPTALPPRGLPGRKILFVGGGNLSFELSFARRHPKLVEEIVATSYESQEEFNSKQKSIWFLRD